MKKKFIIQIKRRYFWKDVVSYYNEKEAQIAYCKLILSNIEARIVELYYI